MRINGTSPAFGGAKQVKAITKALEKQSAMRFLRSVAVGAFKGITKTELESDVVQIAKKSAIKKQIVPSLENDIIDGFKLLFERISGK